MAAASAALKLGSLVNEEAICSTKKWWSSGDFEALASELDLGFVRSRVMAGPDELSEDAQGTEPRFTDRFAPDVGSIRPGCGWLCSPS